MAPERNSISFVQDFETTLGAGGKPAEHFVPILKLELETTTGEERQPGEDLASVLNKN